MKPLQCDLCGKHFNKSLTIDIHITSNGGNNRIIYSKKTITCYTCMYQLSNNLKQLKDKIYGPK